MGAADLPALELRDVGKRFGALKAIHAVSFSVAAGERYAVLGSNGAGKTTLFNTITGDLLPTVGQIRLHGRDITRWPVHQRIRGGLRRTYQSSLLFRELTVRENLFLATRGVERHRFSWRRTSPDDTSEQHTDELLALCRLEEVGQSAVATLSYGQQRQLEIGMAMAGRPSLILFDEPAAGLSPVERVALTDLLSGLPRHLAFVIIEHDLEIALSVAERVTVMHNGQVLCHGTPAEIEANTEVQAIYMGGRHHA